LGSKKKFLPGVIGRTGEGIPERGAVHNGSGCSWPLLFDNGQCRQIKVEKSQFTQETKGGDAGGKPRGGKKTGP